MLSHGEAAAFGGPGAYSSNAGGFGGSVPLPPPDMGTASKQRREQRRRERRSCAACPPSWLGLARLAVWGTAALFLWIQLELTPAFRERLLVTNEQFDDEVKPVAAFAAPPGPAVAGAAAAAYQPPALAGARDAAIVESLADGPAIKAQLKRQAELSLDEKKAVRDRLVAERRQEYAAGRLDRLRNRRDRKRPTAAAAGMGAGARASAARHGAEAGAGKPAGAAAKEAAAAAARARDKELRARRQKEEAAIRAEQAMARGGKEVAAVRDSALADADSGSGPQFTVNVDADDLTPANPAYADPASPPPWQEALADVRDSVAWAIPVGGPQPRDAILQKILAQLIRDGAGKRNIIIFEDDGSRADGKPDTRLAQVAAKFGVRLVQSSIPKLPSEHTRAGLRNGRHLARHFKFFFDWVFRGENAPGGGAYEYMAVIEDDLWMADDCVRYFQSMTRVMAADDTVFCASGRVDNGFFGTAMDADPLASALPRGHFQFRRGNHFMAPGWMTSRRVYEAAMRPQWLDDKTGAPLTSVTHWDNYMETRMFRTEYDCVFPEVPRLIHMGGGGFSVSRAMQRERFGNLRGSRLPLTVDYGDLTYLTRDGYASEIKWFIEHAVAVAHTGEIAHYRHARIVVAIEAAAVSDHPWNTLFRGQFGVFGVGGYPPNLFKMRGAHKGVAFGRWMSNQVMAVALYSPFYETYVRAHGALPVTVQAHGCFVDRPAERDLPMKNEMWTQRTAPGCALSCRLQGYPVAGLQNGNECWCGRSFGRYGAAKQPRDACGARHCGGQPCGGASHNSIYTLHPGGGGGDGDGRPMTETEVRDQAWAPTNGAAVADLKERLDDPWADARAVQGSAGESCDVACATAGLSCDVHLFPLIVNNCPRLMSLMGCTSCGPALNAGNGFAAPGRDGVSPQCQTSTGMFMRCDAVPDQTSFARACVCRTQGRAFYDARR